MKTNLTKSKNNNAFTLAEVLITLAIVGVVASITIPNLTSKYNKDQTVSNIKKTYSVLSQAVLESSQVNGDVDKWDWGDGTGSLADSRQSFDLYWAPYLKVVKVCASAQDCGYNPSLPDYFKYLNKTKRTNLFYYTRTMSLLGDGTIFIFGMVGTDKIIWIDINASQQPNMLGKDVFSFVFGSGNRLMPEGYSLQESDIMDNCKFNVTGGQYCAAKIIRDGWQIKDDYPW